MRNETKKSPESSRDRHAPLSRDLAPPPEEREFVAGRASCVGAHAKTIDASTDLRTTSSPVSTSLVAKDLDEHSFGASAVKLAVKDLFPRPEVELPIGDGHDHLSSHHLPFEMGIAVIFTRPVMLVRLPRWIKRSESFEPALEVSVESRFVVVDEHTGGDVHGVAEEQTFAHTRSRQDLLHLRCDVQEPKPFGPFEGEIFPVGFHAVSLGC